MYTSITAARVVAMAAFLFAAGAIHRAGAYRLLLCALAGTTALSGALSFTVDDPRRLASDGFTGIYCAFALFFGITWPVMYVVTPAAFPAAHRAFGFGFVSAFSKMGGLVQPMVVAAMLPPSPPSMPSAPPLAPMLPTLPPPPPGMPPQPPGGLVVPSMPPPPGVHSLYSIGLVFTVSWTVALCATILQAIRVATQSAQSRHETEQGSST